MGGSHLAAVFYRALGQKAPCSPVHKPTSLDADDVAQVIQSLGLKKPLIVAWSFGGNVALGLAARRPEAVRAVVVYETPLSGRYMRSFALSPDGF